METPKSLQERSMKIATHNVRGLLSAGKRETIEIWAIKNNIDIILLQETKINQAGLERRENTQFFQRKQRHRGVLHTRRGGDNG